MSHNIESSTELIETVRKSINNDFHLNFKNVENYLSKNIANLKVDSFKLMLETIELSLKKIKDTKDLKCSIFFLIFKLLKKMKNLKNNFFAKKELLLLSEQKLIIFH